MRIKACVALALMALMTACAQDPVVPDGATGISMTAIRTSVCHVNGTGAFQLISVADPALPTHIAHGDAVPGDPVPGNAGYAFDDGCHIVADVDYAVNVVPDNAAIDPASPGNLFVGSGIPATNFGTARNEALGIELGMMVLYRQGPTVASADTYADGVLNFSVATGSQSTTNGSFADNLTRAAWNFTYSVATGLNGVASNLTGHTFQLLYDVDPTAGTSYRTLTLENRDGGGPGQLSGFQWRDQSTGLVFISDDQGNATVTQNSENYAFSFFQAFMPGGVYAFGPAQFDIILQALDGTQVIASNHIRVNVGP